MRTSQRSCGTLEEFETAHRRAGPDLARTGAAKGHRPVAHSESGEGVCDAKGTRSPPPLRVLES